MPITPYTQPVESTFVNTEPQLPIRSIATAATQLQKRQDVVRDELDELRNTIVKTEPLSQNREVFAQATEGVRTQIAQIAEDGELFNKLSRVRQLSRDFADTTRAFQQNQKNVQAALTELDEAEMPERVKQQYRSIINQQAQLGLDDNGRVDPGSVFSGISFGDEADITQFALDRAKNLDDRRVEGSNFQNVGNGLLRRTIKEGVHESRVEGEVLTSLGFARDPETGQLYRGASSGNAEVENYFQNRRQILRAQGLSEEEIQERFRKKAKRIVAQAKNKYADIQTRYDFRTAPTGDRGGGDGSGTRTTITGSLSNIPTTDEITEDHPKYEEAVDRENLILENMRSMTQGDVNEEEIDTYREVEKYLEENKGNIDNARFSYYGIQPRSADEQVRDRFGETVYDTWKAVQQTKNKLVKQTSFDSRIIGFSSERQEARKDAEEYLSQISGETLVSPDVEGGSWPWSSTESGRINSILKDPSNFTFQGITEDGRYAVILDHDNGNQQVRIRMDTPGADPVFQELTNIVTGSPEGSDARVLRTNNQLANRTITSNEFTQVSDDVGLSRNVSGYTAQVDGHDLTFDRYMGELADQGLASRQNAEEFSRLAQLLPRVTVGDKTGRDVGITPRTAAETLRTYMIEEAGGETDGSGVPKDMKQFLDGAMKMHIPFDSRGLAAIQAQRFNQLQ